MICGRQNFASNVTLYPCERSRQNHQEDFQTASFDPRGNFLKFRENGSKIVKFCSPVPARSLLYTNFREPEQIFLIFNKSSGLTIKQIFTFKNPFSSAHAWQAFEIRLSLVSQCLKFQSDGQGDNFLLFFSIFPGENGGTFLLIRYNFILKFTFVDSGTNSSLGSWSLEF